MKMYRLEKDGVGPYRHKELSYLVDDVIDENTPLPSHDFEEGFLDYRHLYGVPERKLISHWFKGRLLALYRAGFRVVEIDHPSIVVSKSGLQCAINKEIYKQLKYETEEVFKAL